LIGLKYIVKISCRGCIVAVLFFIFSCSSESENLGQPLAKVYDKTLYASDIDKMIPEDLSPDEATSLRKELVNNWIKQQVILHKSQTEVKDAEKLIQARIEKYRTSLLMYEYERRWVELKLDSTVTNDAITNYYKENIKDFELDDYLVKAILVKTRKSADDIDKVNLWFRSKDSVSIYDESSWLYYDEIEKMLPQEMVLNKSYFVVNKLARKYEGEDYVYFFRILDFRTGISPLDFEKDNIKTRILQMRITKLRDELRKEIIEDAYKNDEIKRY